MAERFPRPPDSALGILESLPEELLTKILCIDSSIEELGRRATYFPSFYRALERIVTRIREYKLTHPTDVRGDRHAARYVQGRMAESDIDNETIAQAKVRCKDEPFFGAYLKRLCKNRGLPNIDDWDTYKVAWLQDPPFNGMDLETFDRVLAAPPVEPEPEPNDSDDSDQSGGSADRELPPDEDDADDEEMDENVDD